MRNLFYKKTFLLFSILGCSLSIKAQLPDCDVYYRMLGNGTFQIVDPLGGTTINNIALPSGASGLAVADNFFSGTPSPTFYTTVGGNYYYYDGSTWVNTGHSSGSVNPGGAGPYIYNLDGINSRIYRYDGTGPSTLFLNLGSFSGPYDVMGDADGNVYVLQLGTPQALNMYDVNANLVCSYNLVNMPQSTYGGGYGIVNGTLYVQSGAGFFEGTINGNTITFTSQSVTGSFTDFANCYFPPINVTMTTPSDLTCANSTVQINSSTSITNPIYSWSGPGIVSGGNTANPIVNQPGTYTVTITSSGGGCSGTATQQVIVNQSSGITININASETSICEGESSDLSVTASGGASPYNYSWDNGLPASNTNTVSPTTTTTYTCTVTDFNGCTGTASETINVTSAPTYTTSTTDPTCGNNDGEIVITPASGFTITDYSIDGGTTTQSNGTFSNLGVGTYSIAITDNNGCEGTGSLTLNNSGSTDDPSFTLTDFCEGDANSANITGTPGGTFTIVAPTGDGASINGSTGEISNGVGGTTYTVEYTTNGACPDSETHDVTVNAGPTFTTVTTDPSCNSNDGEIVITPASGFTITDYSIDGGTTTQSNGTFSNLGVGTYNIVITDNNGCQGTGIESLNNPGGVTLNVVSSTDISCYGADDGSGEVSASGGTSPYTYNWSPTGSNAETATDLPPGTYTVTVTDDGGCTDDVQITITEPNAITVNETITPSDCGLDNGEIDLNVTGGTGNYTYTWNPNVSTTNQATDLAVGTYEVTVTDDNNCSKTISYNIEQANSFYIEVIPDSAVTIQQGESVNINLFVDPNVTVDNISWFPTSGLSCIDCKNPVATPDNSTTYIVAVTDDNGCVSTDTVQVNVILPCAEIFVPNTFSPNNDGLNDLQCVLGECIVSMDFTIFNRWGESVFQTKDQEECWNGMFKGKLVQSGTYAYKLKATLKDGKQVERTGNITVVR